MTNILERKRKAKKAIEAHKKRLEKELKKVRPHLFVNSDFLKKYLPFFVGKKKFLKTTDKIALEFIGVYQQLIKTKSAELTSKHTPAPRQFISFAILKPHLPIFPVCKEKINKENIEKMLDNIALELIKAYPFRKKI